jgi:hypothetical protein
MKNPFVWRILLLTVPIFLAGNILAGFFLSESGVTRGKIGNAHKLPDIWCLQFVNIDFLLFD